MTPTTTPGASDPAETPIDLSRVHLIGIGGAGMSGVAHILLDRGSVVTGSDVKESRPVRALRLQGAEVAIGHARENLELSAELPTVVVTSFAAIPKDNPELVRAAEEGIPVIRRSDLLGELMEGYTQVLLAGTHGKTTTTAAIGAKIGERCCSTTCSAKRSAKTAASTPRPALTPGCDQNAWRAAWRTKFSSWVSLKAVR